MTSQPFAWLSRDQSAPHGSAIQLCRPTRLSRIVFLLRAAQSNSRQFLRSRLRAFRFSAQPVSPTARTHVRPSSFGSTDTVQPCHGSTGPDGLCTCSMCLCVVCVMLCLGSCYLTSSLRYLFHLYTLNAVHILTALLRPVGTYVFEFSAPKAPPYLSRT